MSIASFDRVTLIRVAFGFGTANIAFDRTHGCFLNLVCANSLSTMSRLDSDFARGRLCGNLLRRDH